MGEEMTTKGKKRKSKKSKIISFDEETVTKEAAEKIVQENRKRKSETEPQITKKKQKNQPIVSSPSPPKKQKKRNASKPPDTVELDIQDELDPKKPQIQTEESIRARKRRKYAKLVEERKLKGELDMQQKCLSYLSLWKHSKNEWKFEKLKQCWLLNNMYDDDRVPEEFYQTLVEYFNNSKGKVKSDILKNALKVIKEEENDDVNKDNDDDDDDAKDKEVNSSVKYERARSIVQHLQE